MSWMDLLTIYLITLSLFSLLLGLFIIIKKKNNISAIFFGLLAISVGIWVSISVPDHFANLNHNLYIGSIFSHLSLSSSTLIFTFFLLFSISFPNNKINYKSGSFRFIIILQLIVLCLIWSMSKFFLKDIQYTGSEHYTFIFFNGPGYFYIFAPYLLVFFVLGFIILLNKFKTLKGIARIQAKYILLASGIAGSLGIFFTLIIPGITPYTEIHYIGRIAAIIFIGVSAYAIIKHRFLDIKFVLRKGTVYAFTIALALGIYSYLVFFISKTSSDIFKINNNATGIFVIILVALGFHPLRKLVEGVLDTYIFPKRVDFRVLSKKIRESLSVGQTNLENLIKTIRKELKNNLLIESTDLIIQKNPVDWGVVEPINNKKITMPNDDWLQEYFLKNRSIIVADELEFQIQETDFDKIKNILNKIKDYCEKSNVSIIIPFFSESEIIGMIMLGAKQKKEVYTLNDINFLENFQQDFTFILSGAIHYFRALERVKGMVNK